MTISITRSASSSNASTNTQDETRHRIQINLFQRILKELKILNDYQEIITDENIKEIETKR